MRDYRYVFGPVRSGRLGLSLGLDCLGARVCSFNCVYCEVGTTDVLTTERKPYVPADVLMDELAAWKREHATPPEYVTLGGLGEPCLNSDLGAIIAGAKTIFPGVPVAVLTNTTPLADPAVRRELATADAVLPSLDSLVPEEYLRINRPHRDVSLESLPKALLDFREEFDGRLWLEVLLCQGVNDSAANLALLRDFCPKLRPDRVDVVTLSRPGASDLARAVPRETLLEWKRVLDRSGEGWDGRPSAAGDRDAPVPGADAGRGSGGRSESKDGAAGEAAPCSGGAPGPEQGQEQARTPVQAPRDGLGTGPETLPNPAEGAVSDADRADDLLVRIINSLKRRPQTSIQLASALDAPHSAIEAALSRLAATGDVEILRVDDEAFYARRGVSR